uniref:F-box domain-containing protein n=1 Tax=Oryza punctata TaxID=4537 RepID=A0A0E0LC72_ORYPU
MENLLPEDVLVNILHRLAPRCLAISPCVCKPWRTIIDARRLLRVDLLPYSAGGIFINFHDLILSEFLSRPSTRPTVSGNFNYLPHNPMVTDHCNGLLLLVGYVVRPPILQYHVVNPATRQWVQLPPRPSPRPETMYFENKEYLVFDPTVSSHFEVFVIPYACDMPYASSLLRDIQLDPMIEEIEWPPLPCTMHVFSSRTKQWEERLFVREGEAAGTLANRRPNFRIFLHNAVYWQGVLYVRCQANNVMRISPSDGRSQKGMYCTFIDHPNLVYILDESYGKMEWVPTHRIGYVPRQAFHEIDGPWTLQDINYHEDPDHYGYDNGEAIEERKFEWDSDNDNVIDTKARSNLHLPGYITFLGFHPYKEVVFLSHTLTRGLAYHLNTRKVQDLGNLCPKHYGTGMGIQPFIEGSFAYTPWIGEFPEEN